LKRSIGKILGIFVFPLFFFISALNLSSLGLEDVLYRVNETDEVRNAILVVESARKQVEMLRYNGNVSVSLQPSEKTTSSAVSLSGSVSLIVPLGLSDNAITNLEKAEDNLKFAEKSLKETRARALLNLYSKYQEAWLAQAEQRVFDAEVTYSESVYAATRSRFESGEVSLTELAAAEEALAKARENSVQGMLAARIAWFELASAVGLDLTSSVLMESIPGTGDLPKPPELSRMAYDNLASIQGELLKIEEIEKAIKKLDILDYGLSVKPFFNYGEHSVLANYNFAIPNVTLSYSFPVTTFTFGSTTDSSGSGMTSQDSSWNAGVSVNLSLDLGKERNLEREALLASLKIEEAKLRALKSSVDLDIRSRYQKWILAGDMVKQAERNLSRMQNNKAILQAKLKLGLVGEDSIMEADVLIERAEWNLNSARIEQEKARLAVAAAAGYVPDEYRKYFNEK